MTNTIADGVYNIPNRHQEMGYLGILVANGMGRAVRQTRNILTNEDMAGWRAEDKPATTLTDAQIGMLLNWGLADSQTLTD